MSNKKAEVIRLLNILRGYYSLRDLQDMLGVPYQTLWKYVNLVSVPEEKTCDRILTKISESNLIEKLLMELTETTEESYASLSLKPSFLLLFALFVRNFTKGSRIGTVVSMSEMALPLATSAAIELNTSLCPALTSPRVQKGGIYPISYAEGSEIKMKGIPKICLKEKGRALLVDSSLTSVDKLYAFLIILKQARTMPFGVITVSMSKDVEEALGKEGLNHYSFNITGVNAQHEVKS